MSTTLTSPGQGATPAPAPTVAPSAIPAQPSSPPERSSMRSMIAADLAAAGGDNATDQSGETQPTDVTPGAQPEEVVQPTDATAAPATEAAVEDEPDAFAEPEEDVPFESKPDWVPDRRWKQVYPKYKLAREIEKQLGFQPSVEDVKGFHEAFIDRVAMESDIASGDPAAADKFLGAWLVTGPDGQPRQNAAAVAGRIPGLLAKTNPAAYAAVATPVLQGYEQGMYNRWQGEASPEVKQALWSAFQVLYHDRTGNYYSPDGNAAPSANGKPAAGDPFAAERQRISQERTALNQERGQMAQQAHNRWQGELVTAVDGEVESKLDLALSKPLASIKEKAPGQYRSAKKDFKDQVVARVEKDPQWAVYQSKVSAAARSRSETDNKAAADFYGQMTARAIAALRPDFLRDYGLGVVSQSKERHEALAATQGNRAPSTGGPPRAQSIVTEVSRKPGESNVDYIKRRMAADAVNV